MPDLGLFGRVLGGLVGAPNADPSNPDGLGCGAVAGTLSMAGPGFLEPLGGPGSVIEPDVPVVPCQGDEYTRPAMAPQEQRTLLMQAAVAFFDAHLGASPTRRSDGCRDLLYELPKHPAVTVE